MPVGISEIVHQVAGRNAAFDEGEMIVAANSLHFAHEHVSKSQALRFVPDQIVQPRRRRRIAFQFQIAPTNHIHQNHGLQLFELPGQRHPRGHFAAAHGAVVRSPANALPVRPLSLRFFAIEKRHPDGNRIFSCTEMARKFQNYAASGGAVVRSHEIRNSHRIVVRGIHHDGRLPAGSDRQNIFHRSVSERRRSVKILLADLAAKSLQLFRNVCLRFVDCFGTRRSRPNLNKASRMFVRSLCIETFCSSNGFRCILFQFRGQTTASKREHHCQQTANSDFDFHAITLNTVQARRCSHLFATFGRNFSRSNCASRAE